MKSASVKILVLVAMVTNWYPVATQDLPPVNEDNLDPNAAHVCQTTTQEPYTQTTSFTQYYIQSTTTWCLAIPPRCTQYRIAARTAYRVDTLYRNRAKYFCCDGYKALPQHSYCVPKCTDNCNANKSQGYCVTPGKCVCYPGYKGDTCASGCATNKWGPDCSNTCNCGSHGSCDPLTGNCICQIGYTGSSCSQPCVNSFGLHCIHPCVCENNATCDNVNGKCTCKPGYYGAYCHKQCDTSSTTDLGCAQTCPCQNGGTCQPGNTSCICAAGYMGQYCTETCDSFHWGVNCTKQCQCNFGVCNPATGQCSCELGYAGQRCEIKCPTGYYGLACLTKCGCENDGKCYWNSTVKEIRCNCQGTGFHGDTCSERDCPDGQYLLPGVGPNQYPCQNCSCDTNPGRTESCQPLTGKCFCGRGYKGERCSETCSMPFYGEKCAEVCLCEHGDCHHFTGECTSCYAGYIGPNCSQTCPEQKWGAGCVNTCDCENKARCHPSTGYCECLPGYYGRSCEKYCPLGTYGPTCSFNCTCDTETSTCDPQSGQCWCKPGYMGKDCQQMCSPWKYDFFCRKDCDCDRNGAQSCDHRTGHCQCRGGFSGFRCENKCPNHTWGQNCVNICDCNGRGSCHPDNGNCICMDGYQGNKCQQDSNGVVVSVVGQQTGHNPESTAAASTSPIIIAVVVPCVILLLIIAAVVWYFTRKIRFMKEDNYRVEFRNNQANGFVHEQTSLPNGRSVGVENPTYEDDNQRNDNRYPHLSQRLSTLPPPLPQRQKTCDEIDVEKLRVSVPVASRPMSSQYAELDDIDRYTTLKSVSNPTLNSMAAQKGTGEFNPGDFHCDSDVESEGQRSGSSTMTSGGVRGFDNHAYGQERMSAEKHLGQSSLQCDARQKAPNDYDVPASSNLQHTQINDLATCQANGYLNVKSLPKSKPLNGFLDMNSNQKLSPESKKGEKSPQNNPYDIPKVSLSTGNHDSRASVGSDGYLTPRKATDFHCNPSAGASNNHTDLDFDLDFEEGDLQNGADNIGSSLFQGSDKNVLIKDDFNQTNA